MKYPKIPLASTIVQLCRLKNIQHIVISPGSRNAPLTIGFTENPFFKTYSIIDERSAAFIALGIAQQLQQPVAVVCTSGSALLNYYPAVSEAFYSDIPLVIISADRPPYAIDIGDGQTIRQDNIFEKHIVYSANLKPDIRDTEFRSSVEGKTHNIFNLQEEVQKSNENEINKTFNLAIAHKGHVHLNVPFEEPLYGVTDTLPVKVKSTSLVNLSEELTIQELTKYAHIWNTSTRKIILTGVHPPDSIENSILDSLAEDNSVLVFTETTSNIYHDSFFPGIDKIIAPIELSANRDELFKKLQPDVLLTFGGMVVSKKIKAFFRKYKPKHHWHIDSKKAYDTFFCLEKHFKVHPNNFFKIFLKLAEPQDSDYRLFWKSIKENTEKKHTEYLRNTGFSDLKAFDIVLKSIPDNYQLQLSNSSTIRYTQLFNINPTLKVFCNRGTSGIDGSTSTAVGASLVSEKPTLLITGDLGFFYDSNALWNNYIKKDFRIIVVNNRGGGIFRILPGNKDSENFDTYFETIHDLDASHLCKMHGFEYLSVSSDVDLEKKLNHFYKPSKYPMLLEIFTPRELNDLVLIDYFKFLGNKF